MTKIKNTKKGMAKKTLSISLAVAMLATSNVPVWAAEDLFTDGEVAVEAFDADVFSDDAAVAEEAPVVEEEEAVDSQAINDDANDVNEKDYKVSNFKIGTVGGWNLTVSAEGTITNIPANTVLHYKWMADGVEASNINGNLPSQGQCTVEGDSFDLSTIKYFTAKADFDKELSLQIYVLSPDDKTNVFSQTVKGGKVQPKDVSNVLNGVDENRPNGVTPELYGVNTNGEIPYNGKEQKPTVQTSYWYWENDINTHIFGNENIDWHYNTPGEDFENVTGKDITVYGEVIGTYDPTSPAYGYVGTTNKATYQIVKANVKTLELSMKTKEVPYIGAVHDFGKNDVTMTAVLANDVRIDISDALKDDAVFMGTVETVGTNRKIDVNPTTDFYWSKQLDSESTAMNNVITEGAEKVVVDGYEIQKLDLTKCVATTKEEFKISDFKGLVELTTAKESKIKEGITLTTPDGRTFPLSQIGNDVALTVERAVVDAANAGRTGTVKDGFKISYKTNPVNVDGAVTLDVNLVVDSLGNVYVHEGTNTDWTPLVDDPADAQITKVPYIGKAYNPAGTNGALHTLTVNPKNSNYNIPTSEYTVSYKNLTTNTVGDTTNAGIIEVTITANADTIFRGSKTKVYFQIEKDVVSPTDISAKGTATINPENNYDASKYADAMAVKLETALNDDVNNKAVLENGKDYTVKYYYVTAADAKKDGLDVDTIKNSDGTNNVGDYIFAVATLDKNSNFKKAAANTEYFVRTEITEKSIANVTVAPEKESYTYTGKEIRANVKVTDGSVVLTDGVDYTLKYKNNKNVGTATIEVIPLEGSDYDVNTKATTTFEITPAKAEDVEVTFTQDVFDYTGKQIKPVVAGVTLNGVSVVADFDIKYPVYGENVNAGKDAGSVTIAPKTTTKNFTGTKTEFFDIKGKELKGGLKLYYGDKTQVTVTGNVAYNKKNPSTPYSFYYDGQEQTFAEARFTADALYNVAEGVDYEIKYINNTVAGTAFVAVVAKGNYEGNLGTKTSPVIFNDLTTGYKVIEGQLLNASETIIEKNIVDIIAFNIEPSIFTARNITVTNGTYAGGKPVKPSVAVVVNGRTLVEGTDYKLALTAIEGTATPDKFVDVTTDKPYYVDVIPMGGYAFDNVNGSSKWTWGIDKKDLADCAVTVTKNGEELELKVMNGNVVELKEAFDVVDNGDGTATVSVVDGGKNYTGSQTVTIIDPTDKGAVGMVSIKDVKVVGNKATVILDGPAENAEGYDYVIATEDDYVNGRVDITKNQLKTTGDFFYVQNGTYYAYCHAYRHDEETGKKVFSPEFSERFKFSVTATTPDTPVITDVVRKGSTVTVTYNTADNAAGYDIVLGTASRKVNGEKRPVEYGTLVKKNQTKTTVTFTNVPAGTYYVGMHAYNRTSADGKKVFSPWANWSKKVTVK